MHSQWEEVQHEKGSVDSGCADHCIDCSPSFWLPLEDAQRGFTKFFALPVSISFGDLSPWLLSLPNTNLPNTNLPGTVLYS